MYSRRLMPDAGVPPRSRSAAPSAYHRLVCRSLGEPRRVARAAASEGRSRAGDVGLFSDERDTAWLPAPGLQAPQRIFATDSEQYRHCRIPDIGT